MTSVCVQGEAEAYAIEVKAKAEAEQMAKKADAWKEYKEAALVDMMLQVRNKFIFLKIFFSGIFFCPSSFYFTLAACNENRHSM